MSLRSREKRPRWRRKRERRDTGLTFLRQINWYHLKTPPKELPGFLMAALPFVLAAGIAWPFPGFWQVPVLVAAGALLGVVVLKVDWPRVVKAGFGVAVLLASISAFALSGTEVGPFVLPVLGAAFALSFLRARALERDARERDSWRQR